MINETSEYLHGWYFPVITAPSDRTTFNAAIDGHHAKSRQLRDMLESDRELHALFTRCTDSLLKFKEAELEFTRVDASREEWDTLLDELYGHQEYYHQCNSEFIEALSQRLGCDFRDWLRAK